MFIRLPQRPETRLSPTKAAASETEVAEIEVQAEWKLDPPSPEPHLERHEASVRRKPALRPFGMLRSLIDAPEPNQFALHLN